MVISKAEDRSFFKRFRLNYVIYDEGHMLRSCNTIRYTNLMRIQGQKKILLTGTPLQNNLVELISLLFFAMSKMFTRYCEDIKTLLALFVQRGAVLKNKPATKKRGKKIKEAEEDLDDKELEVLTNTPMSEEDGPMYAKHKISQAKSILQPFVLRRLKSEVIFFQFLIYFWFFFRKTKFKRVFFFYLFLNFQAKFFSTNNFLFTKKYSRGRNET